jgi:hypothetical protein
MRRGRGGTAPPLRRIACRMLSPRDRNRMRALAAVAPGGSAVVLHAWPEDDALDVVAALVAGGRPRVHLVGAYEPTALRTALAQPPLYGRVQVSLGAPVTLANGREPAVALLCLPAGRPHLLQALGAAWGGHVITGGYLALWGGTAPSLAHLGLTPAKWDGYPAPGRIELAHRRPQG